MRLLKYLIFCLGLSHVSFDLAMDTSGKGTSSKGDTGEKDDKKWSVKDIIEVTLAGASITSLAIGLLVKLIKFAVNKVIAKKQGVLNRQKTLTPELRVNLEKEIKDLKGHVKRLGSVEKAVEITRKLINLAGLTDLLVEGNASATLIEGLLLSLSKTVPSGQENLSDAQSLIREAIDKLVEEKRVGTDTQVVVSDSLLSFLSQDISSFEDLKDFAIEFKKLIEADESNPEGFIALFEKYKEQIRSVDTKVKYSLSGKATEQSPLSLVEDLDKFRSAESRGAIKKGLAQSMKTQIDKAYPEGPPESFRNFKEDLQNYVDGKEVTDKKALERVLDLYSSSASIVEPQGSKPSYFLESRIALYQALSIEPSLDLKKIEIILQQGDGNFVIKINDQEYSIDSSQSLTPIDNTLPGRTEPPRGGGVDTPPEPVEVIDVAIREGS